MPKTFRHYTAGALLTLMAALPTAVLAQAASPWPEGTQDAMVEECVTSLTDSVVAESKQQAGLEADAPLPDEMRQALDNQFIPQFQNTCGCVIGRLAERHSYDEVQNNPDLARDEANKVGTPGGCPLNL